MTGKNELSVFTLTNRVRDQYFGCEAETAATTHAGGGAAPNMVLNITHKGKKKTSSQIKGFEDCVYCYDFILCEGLNSTAPGATGASAYSSEPAIVYIPRNADVQVVGITVDKDVVDIEVAKLFEANGKKQAEEVYEFKDARFCTSPVNLGAHARGFIFTYDSREYKYFQFDESGTKKGVSDQAKTVFSKGENQ